MSVRTPLTLATIDAGAGLRAASRLSPAAVIEEVASSGLRGRGGAGFRTGLKWRLTAEAPAPRGVRHIVCNADEGEPGTFKDRVLLSDFSDLVVEGMTIAGYAVGARDGVLYLRGEYAYLRPELEQCLARRRGAGLLGPGILGVPDFEFDVTIRLGAGAYICGEETALLESLEGRRGEPRNRLPFPVTRGLHQDPTVINNVETFAWVSAILAKGADWFAAIGTPDSSGPKLLSVSGDVDRPGVYEFPFGVTIAEVLQAAGGPDAQAVVVGGACGQCVPARDFSRSISHSDASTGGALIVLGPERDLLEAAQNFLEFFVDESCGQCTPCRLGNPVLLEGIRALRRGTCSPERLGELQRLGRTLQDTAKCGLGQSSPNFFLSLVDVLGDQLVGHTPRMTAASVAKEL
ncbi:MAG TPA: NADH-ubiquinone oxidoreductase-F iron-sulfur binding region domain-containing protein [Dermatophilaceae bacterium]|nr:NADH-ubiquinone oxidoreductase-F iron-sulfur binding region domain-containing protein [Dermatophilaceae bacterium]